VPSNTFSPFLLPPPSNPCATQTSVQTPQLPTHLISSDRSVVTFQTSCCQGCWPSPVSSPLTQACNRPLWCAPPNSSASSSLSRSSAEQWSSPYPPPPCHCSESQGNLNISVNAVNINPPDLAPAIISLIQVQARNCPLSLLYSCSWITVTKRSLLAVWVSISSSMALCLVRSFTELCSSFLYSAPYID